MRFEEFQWRLLTESFDLLEANPSQWIDDLICIYMMMNYFCGMVDRRKALSFLSSWDHCQRFSPLKISCTPRAGFEFLQNLSSGFVSRLHNDYYVLRMSCIYSV